MPPAFIIEPASAPLPICNWPAVTVVAPVYVLLPAKITVPVPVLLSVVPVPAITPLTVSVSATFMFIAPLVLALMDAMLEVVAPVVVIFTLPPTPPAPAAVLNAVDSTLLALKVMLAATPPAPAPVLAPVLVVIACVYNVSAPVIDTTPALPPA